MLVLICCARFIVVVVSAVVVVGFAVVGKIRTSVKLSSLLMFIGVHLSVIESFSSTVVFVAVF